MAPPLPRYFAVLDHNRDRVVTDSYHAKRYKILGAVARSTNYNGIPSFDIFRPPVTLGEQARKMVLESRWDTRTPRQHATQVYLKQESGPNIITYCWTCFLSVWYPAENQWIPVIGFIDHEQLIGNYHYCADKTPVDCKMRQMIQNNECEEFRAEINRLRASGQQNVASISRQSNARESKEEDSDYEADEDLLLAIHRSLEPRPPAYEMVQPAAPAPTAPAPRPPPIQIPPQPNPLLPSAAPPARTRAPTPPRGVAHPVAPRHVLEVLKQDAISKGDSCPISFTPFAECDSITVTSCFHLFETAALEQWFKAKQLCPTCKQLVKSHSAIPR